MRTMSNLLRVLFVVLISITLMSPAVALAKKADDSCPGKSCEAPGQNKVKEDKIKDETDEPVENVDEEEPVFDPAQAKKLSKGSSDVKGNLKTRQHIYYEGDTIEVSIKFSRGWEMLADGTIDAHVVVITPEKELLPFPVDPSIGPSDRKFFNVELESSETLPVGQYQLGLILTLGEGDPLNLADWYNGFRGLMDMEGILISAQALPEDADMDGECDFDVDGDGFCDEATGTDDDDSVDDDEEAL